MEIIYNMNKIQYLPVAMKKITAACGDYLVYFHPFTIVPNVFMRNGTYPLMFIGRGILYNYRKIL